MITIEEIEENVEAWFENNNDQSFKNNIKSKFKQAIYDRVDGTKSIKYKLVQKIISLFNEKLSKKEKELLSRYTRLTIQKYEKGEYLKPHIDNYNVHFLMILTDSEIDGITIEDKENSTITFHQDEIGKIFRIYRNTLHWVNPVRDEVRYTVVVIEESGKFFNDTSPYTEEYAPNFDSEGNLIDLEGNLIDSEGNLI